MWRALVLLLLCSLTFFAGLGGPAITDSDEAFYAEAGREMIARGDWITPHFNDEPRFQKPVLFYWLVAGTYAVGGVGEWAARAWAALSGVGLVMVTFVVGRRWHTPGAGFIAGAITATSFGTFWMARQSLPDLPVTFFMTLATWAAIEAVQTSAPAVAPGASAAVAATPAARRRWLIVSAAAMALGLLTKGPVAVVLPLGVAILLILWQRRSRRGEPWTPLTSADLFAALLVFLVIAAPWFLGVTLVHGGDYLVRFFVGENVERFVTARYNEPRSVFFYFPIILGGFLPWTPFLLLWVAPVARVVRGRRRPTLAEVRLGLWALVPFVFYSVSIGKQPRYLLPCLTPLGVLLGASVWRHLRPDRKAGTSGLWMTACLATSATIILVGVLVLRARPVLAAADPDWSPAGPLVMILAGILSLCSSMLRWPRVAFGVLVGAAAATLLALQASVISLGRPEPVEVVAAAVRASGPVSTLCTCGAFTRNLVFYAHQRTVVGETADDAQRLLERPDRVLVVVDSSTLEQIEQRMQRRLTRLANVTYLNVAALRAGDLLDPDPARRLQRIVLVSNR